MACQAVFLLIVCIACAIYQEQTAKNEQFDLQNQQKADENNDDKDRERRKGPKREFNFEEMFTDGRLKDVVLEREEAQRIADALAAMKGRTGPGFQDRYYFGGLK